MNQLEDLVRAAQEAQAERAVEVDRIRAALPALARRRRRQRRGVTAAIVAAAVAAVAVAAPVLVGKRPAPAPVVAAAPVPTGFALGYQPAWAPSGYVETRRQLTGNSLLRVWTKNGPDAGVASNIRLTVYPAAADQDPAAVAGLPTATVSGATGYWVHQSNGGRLLNWRPAPHVSIGLLAEGADVSEPDLLRMARSMRPVGAAGTVPLRLPYVPAGLTATTTEIGGSRPAEWDAQITLTGPGRRITVTYGTYPDAPRGGETSTIADRPARRPIATDPDHRNLVYLVVDWGNGRYLSLEGSGVSSDDLTEIAQSARTVPTGLDWIGR